MPGGAAPWSKTATASASMARRSMSYRASAAARSSRAMSRNWRARVPGAEARSRGLVVVDDPDAEAAHAVEVVVERPGSGSRGRDRQAGQRVVADGPGRRAAAHRRTASARAAGRLPSPGGRGRRPGPSARAGPSGRRSRPPWRRRRGGCPGCPCRHRCTARARGRGRQARSMSGRRPAKPESSSCQNPTRSSPSRQQRQTWRPLTSAAKSTRPVSMSRRVMSQATSWLT